MAETIKYSSSYAPTLKEVPAEAETASHQLLLRAGLVRKMASGVYIYLPLGLRIINKIAAIVREEMNRAGFQELLLPMVQPGDLWRETGRWVFYGKELLRFTDRNDRDYCLGPTHEEVITDLIRGEVKSYKQLPVRLYQIQTKFRDEMRPRFGLMRGREFLMKDGYSFDASLEDAKKSYQLMYDAYMRIFKRLGLQFRAVEADTGSIGGKFSHEFMILADVGEDSIVACEKCDFAANVERAEVVIEGNEVAPSKNPVMEISTPEKHTVDEVCEFLKQPPQKLIKTLIYNVDNKPVAILVRGDREANEAKLKRLLNAEVVEFAPPDQVLEITGAPVGFAGPFNLDIPIYADNELKFGNDYVTGANKKDTHLLNVNPTRDFKITQWADLRNIAQDDCCPRCKEKIFFAKGIEAGHIFMLGDKYSKPMKAVFLDENGKEQTMIMGCYGIGVSRLAAAAIEQSHDENGIIFPREIAPADCTVINLDPKDEKVTEISKNICEDLNNLGFDVFLDDRKERPGIKFKDADLIGFPFQIIIGAKGCAKGIVECKDRKTGRRSELSLKNFQQELPKWLEELKRV